MFLTKEDLLKLARAYSKLPILEEVAAKKAKIDALQNVISQDQRLRLDQKVRLDWNFHSNCIEGNSLDYGQTTAFLMYGFTAKGKPFKDYVDIKGHNEVMDAIIELSKNPDLQLSQRDLREFHSVLLVESYEVKTESITGLPTRKTIQIGEYKTMPNHVKTQTGKTHFYALPEEVPALMTELLDFYHEAKTDADIHPLVVAALLHYQFVAIHPFDDGNGRMSRLLMNLVLMQNHLQPVIIRSEKEAKNAYYDALSDADNGNHETFINLIAEYELAACDLFIKAAHNESIEEPDDIDKEIALLEKSIADKVKEKLNETVYKQVLTEVFPRIQTIIHQAADSFKSLFFQIEKGHYTKHDFQYKQRISGKHILEILDATMNNKEIIQHQFITINFIGYLDKNNPFSFETCLKILFEEWNYTVEVDIEEKNYYEKVYNYPHILSELEINEIKLSTKKAILNYIKSKTN